MKLAFQLAYKNLINSGLRTWLNVGVLAFVFIVILFYKGLLEGWNQSAVEKNIQWEYGQGQLYHEAYDPSDGFTISDAHGTIANAEQKELEPVLIRQATVYPQGRLINILLKGIPADQSVVLLPTRSLDQSEATYPAIIGTRMAETTQLSIGDEVLLRWRDKNGTFDAGNITIVEIFDTDVSTVDQGQIWMSADKVWEMTGLLREATYYIVKEEGAAPEVLGWEYQSQDVLLQDFRDMLEVEEASSMITYFVLLAIALLAIFDTQVLSIFRRQKEIGTYVAMGMTRRRVMVLFTVEGAMYSLFAVAIGCLLGIPLMLYLSNVGISFGDVGNSMGITMGKFIYPTINIELVTTTILIIVISAAVVSFLPARKISKLDPVLALKGKHQ